MEVYERLKKLRIPRRKMLKGIGLGAGIVYVGSLTEMFYEFLITKKPITIGENPYMALAEAIIGTYVCGVLGYYYYKEVLKQ